MTYLFAKTAPLILSPLKLTTTYILQKLHIAIPLNVVSATNIDTASVYVSPGLPQESVEITRIEINTRRSTIKMQQKSKE